MPLPRATGGVAVAIGMLAADALAGRRFRVLWCVDLDRDVGPKGPAQYLCAACARVGCGGECGYGSPCPRCSGPACNRPVVSTQSGTVCSAGHGGAPWFVCDDGRAGRWGALLTRLKAALESQPAGSVYECRVAVLVREDLQGVGPTNITVGLPYRVDPSRLAAAPPPAGVWRFWPEPEPRPDAKYPEVTGAPADYGYRAHGDLPEDRLPVPATFWLDGIPF